MEIEDYPNYLIYPEGRIWSKPRLDESGHLRKGKFLKQFVEKNGYHRVCLSRDKKQKRFLVHRLVAQAFIPNPDNKPEVDHINKNKSDNRLENLRWVTSLENCENRGIPSTNTSGHKYISYQKGNNSWKFEKVINKKIYQKLFRTKIDAICYKFCFILLNQRRKRLACGVRL
tara:strand:+ start:301 stop:816 length:516 start_codon:yes stop_codon:yes gene_type:complete